jgi:hypothetical protein
MYHYYTFHSHVSSSASRLVDREVAAMAASSVGTDVVRHP